MPHATGSSGPQHNVNSYHNYESASSDHPGGQGTNGPVYEPGTWQDGAQTAPFDRPANQREAFQSQSLILEHLSQNPSLAANISDSVLRQLIDVGQISGGGAGSAASLPPAGSQHHQHQYMHAAHPPHHHHEHLHHNHHQYQSQQNRPPPPYRRRTLALALQLKSKSWLSTC